MTSIKEYIKYLFNRRKEKDGWRRVKAFTVGRYGRWQQRGIWNGKYQENEVVGCIVYDESHYQWQLPYAIKRSGGYPRTLPICKNGAKIPTGNGKWKKLPKQFFFFQPIKDEE